jgi:hypothetical protein
VKEPEEPALKEPKVAVVGGVGGVVEPHEQEEQACTSYGW